MKLEKIGFYTLSEYRALHSSENSPLYRCEMIVTGRCNFNCQYCRKIETKDIDFELAINILRLWVNNGLRNVRFSGGEPTLYPYLEKLIDFCDNNNVNRIAISTNGSSDLEYYINLWECGVNDFSISLDACCAIDNNKMNGVDGYWDKIVMNIRELSKLTYVTVGVVLDERNIEKTKNIIEFAHELGVSDIRIIPAAQYKNRFCDIEIKKNILYSHPILYYRLFNNDSVRGLSGNDSKHCYLGLDDMVCDVYGNHYPCIIYFREGGKAIGKINDDMRITRKRWVESHDCLKDHICKNNCLDVCRDYNNFFKKNRNV